MPCKKYDMDAHGNSMSFFQVSFVFHADFGESKSWNFYDVRQENDGISIGFGVIFDQNEWKKEVKKIHVTFFTGCFQNQFK